MTLTKDELKTCKDLLNFKIKITESLPKALSAFTTKLCARLEGNPPAYASHYVLEFFRCYCAHMDEVMVLLQGELIRSYQQQSYSPEFTRGRGNETKYYKNFPLTAVSVDGLNYEMRQIKKRSSWLERFGEEVDALSFPINPRLDDMESNVAKLISSLKQIGAVAVDCRMLRKHHKGETIRVTFPDELGVKPSSMLVLSRDMLATNPRYQNRRESLSVEIRDPEGYSAQKAEVLKKQANETRVELEKVKQAEREALADVPLDEVKRQYGMDTLLSTVTTRIVDLEGEGEGEDQDAEVELEHLKANAAKMKIKKRRREIGDWEEGDDFSVDSAADVLPSTAATQPPSIPTRIVLLPLQSATGGAVASASAGVPVPHCRELNVFVQVPTGCEAIVGGNRILLKIDISGNPTMSLGAAVLAADSYMLVGSDQVLYEVYMRLWEKPGRSRGTGSRNRSMPFLPLLASVTELSPQQIAEKMKGQYSINSDQLLLSPGIVDVFVYCEENLAAIGAMEALQKRLSLDDAPPPPLPILHRLRSHLLSSPIPSSFASLTSVVELDLSGLGGVLLNQRLLLAALLASCKSPLSVSTYGTLLDGAALFELISRCSVVDVSCAGLHARHLKELVLLLSPVTVPGQVSVSAPAAGPNPAPAFALAPKIEFSLPLVELIAINNHLLLDSEHENVTVKDNNDKNEESIEKSLELLFCLSPRLERVDFSFNAESLAEMRRLGHALVRASTSRIKAGLSSPRDLVVKGMMTSDAELVKVVRDGVEGAMQGCALDASGFNFAQLC